MKDELSFETLISEHGMGELIKNARLVIVAFSGGADSSALLRLIDTYTKKLGVPLVAAHVNHMIRGDAADSDEKFCRDVCGKLEIPIYVKKADVPAMSEKLGMGVEECARKVRYEFFDELSLSLTGSPNGAVIATAHNADDNLETVIFNMLRGSGTRGMCGIPPVRDKRYIRPLLNAGGDKIRAWCKKNGVPYVIDKTNTDTDYTRNHVRHNIVPMMREICADPAKAVSRMTSLIRRDEDFLTKTAEAYVQTGGSAIERKILTSLHPSIAARVLRSLYHSASGSYDIEENHIRSALELARGDSTEASLSMPHGIKFILDRDSVSFKLSENNKDQIYCGEIVFEYPNDGDKFENELYTVAFSEETHVPHTQNTDNAENIYKLSIRKSFCFDRIKGTLKIRYRTPGDTYRFGNMTRKVKKLFGDRKMSSAEKALTPVFTDDCGIVWIPGFPPRDGVASTAEKKDSKYITCTVTKNII